MTISNSLFSKYNIPQTLFVLSSFPKKGGEVAEENAVARYSSLLLQNFDPSQKIVVICEKRNASDHPYELTENILVVPTYKTNSLQFAFEVIGAMKQFDQVKNLMVQFEFSIFGGKIALPGIITILGAARIQKIHTTFMFHQVIRDLGKLSGHLGIGKKSLYRNTLNLAMSIFYATVGALSQRIVVHDSMLKEALHGLVSSEKISVIPHGCGDTAYLSPELRASARRKLKISQKELVVLAYGYLSWYKGTDWIIKTVAQLSKKYPKLHIKLLLPGVQSPTLKGTNAYALYQRRLYRLLKRYSNVVVAPGFIPEAEVDGIFAAADIAVFPYRAKMSASGALSLAWQYGKRVLVSTEFAKNYDEVDAHTILARHDVSLLQLTFPLNTDIFEQVFLDLLHRPGAGYNVARASRTIAQLRSWKNVAQMYREVCVKEHENYILAPKSLLSDA